MKNSTSTFEFTPENDERTAKRDIRHYLIYIVTLSSLGYMFSELFL